MLCLMILLVGQPAESPKPNSLDPARASAGWIKLFDGQSTYGWKVEGPGRIENGTLILGGDKPSAARSTVAIDRFEYLLEIQGQGGAGCFVRLSDSGPKIWSADQTVNEKFHRSSGRTEDPGCFPRYWEICVPAGGIVRLRSLEVRPWFDSTSDLIHPGSTDGWRIHPDEKYKSRFHFDQAGILTIKDGPGDIQTKKTFGDFVFQGEARTAADHLNSGIFFRCLPGQYQQGYECQIRNQVDGRTGQPIDFGTGGIYRRAAARAIVARDKEWFTVTILARGRQLSTWVDGWMTCDWTDERAPNENARQGYRAMAGAISLQGHDPTTDVSFRNLRARELGDPK
ncbi:MAG: DUF1080 domain-containing protein [Gemmataceae bacterium]|nr:DUF1080 domain-containing protein [Gemmataceae bacterium]